MTQATINDDPARPCPVCRNNRTTRFIEVDARLYHRCPRCRATFLDPDQLPTAAQERAHYLTHENDPSDTRYRAFLERLAAPMQARLPAAAHGLDFGCGPGPALAIMLREAGHTVDVYDPFFARYPAALEKRYDFITCSEVVEHFHAPHNEFAMLDGLLRPGGWFGVMTQFQTDDARFATWHYRKDPTHVVFYRQETFVQIAQEFDWTCDCLEPNIALFRKNAGPSL
ncbi:MAG: methyltransferase domain-containing protein [Hyphomicrobiaceae bacterium]